MIHRIALLLGGLAAAGILAFGVLRGDRTVSGAPPDEAVTSASTGTGAATGPREVVETVYIAAPRRPRVVRVTRHTQPAAGADEGPAVAATRRHRDDDDHEGREHEGRQHDRHGEEDD